MSENDSIELTLLREARRVIAALATPGKLIALPVAGDEHAIEIQYVENGRGRAFEPPAIVRV